MPSLQDITVYMAVRTCAWLILFLCMLVHTARHTYQARKLFRLTHALILSMGLFAHRDFWVTLLSAVQRARAETPLLYVASLMDDAAEAVFLVRAWLPTSAMSSRRFAMAWLKQVMLR